MTPPKTKSGVRHWNAACEAHQKFLGELAHHLQIRDAAFPKRRALTIEFVKTIAQELTALKIPEAAE